MMLKHGRPGSIINVISGGAFVPQVFAPIYSACKAALHSYTLTLRHALNRSSVKVVELIPPAVQTGLAPTAHGARLDEFCDAVFSALPSGNETIGFGPTDTPEFRRLIEAVEPVFERRSASFAMPTHTPAAP